PTLAGNGCGIQHGTQDSFGEEEVMMQPAEVRPFEMRLIQRGARLRRSPYFDATQRYGCRAVAAYSQVVVTSGCDDPGTAYGHSPGVVMLLYCCSGRQD